MTVTPGEVAGLPEGGPATLETAKPWCNIADADTRDDDRITMLTDAVNRKVRTFPIAGRSVLLDDDDLPTGWTGDIILGAVMLVGRLWARKDSPNGVAAFGDLGPVYVQRNDPDIALMLGLGDYAKPGVG